MNKKNVGLLIAGLMLAAEGAFATCTGSPLACAVDFSGATADTITVGTAVVLFGLGVVGIYVIYKLMFAAKRA